MKKMKYILLCLSALVWAFSCQNDDGGIPDTGDLKQGIIMPGQESVTLCCELKANSKAKTAKVVWGEKETESVSFDIDLTADNRFRKKIVIPEGSYMFRVLAYDAGGRKVIDFPMAGRSCGATYTKDLANRVPLFKLSKSTGKLNITWGDIPKGNFRSVIKYTKTGASQPVEVNVTATDKTTVLEDFQDESTFTVLSYYYPDIKLYLPSTRPSSVPGDFVYDEFSNGVATEYTVGFPSDVTALYIKNPGPGMARADGGGDKDKWGTPKDWNTTDNVRNRNDNTVGSWATENGGRLQFENPNWSDTPVVNGKYWQTANIPNGTYRFTFEYAGTMTPAVTNIHIVASDGTELPDAENIAGALAYKKIDSATGGQYYIDFTLTENKQVSLGFVINLTGGPTYVLLANWVTLIKLPEYDI